MCGLILDIVLSYLLLNNWFSSGHRRSEQLRPSHTIHRQSYIVYRNKLKKAKVLRCNIKTGIAILQGEILTSNSPLIFINNCDHNLSKLHLFIYIPKLHLSFWVLREETSANRSHAETVSLKPPFLYQTSFFSLLMSKRGIGSIIMQPWYDINYRTNQEIITDK